ncbi:ribosomal-protein-alanine N-acetyltransferase [Flavobacterium sp. CG_23.5]|uniref:GNAT family N-acetyltransferase n=1 Tax=unclassified Flavobacterium TaxID=196869 RepID=UPI0018CAABEE|nr:MULTISPECIES: GNAT family N-acetyltransferase [unclassified Flavobacterium]MBG6109179.1 ribosomal-protein-alanine N-acetyltransferase [Flavobacterium sp. CG_9.10]MBP2283557.1 ribosomal-protein-alanine N-acetyltransferase [Flavobacterium sp. CG_23.5]
MRITENFIIDKLKPTDANQLYHFMLDNNERLCRFFPLTLSGNSTVEKSIAYIALKEKEIQEKTNFTFAIREVDSQKIAGLIIIKKIDWVNRTGELAYCIGKNFEGKGLVSKTVKAISNFAFNELDLKILQIIAHKTNLASVKVAKNANFSWVKTLLNEFTPTNEAPLDMELYELTR